MAVFVTDGNQRATLAVVRALGQAGIPVTVGESSHRSLAGSSRYCAKRVCYPSPETRGDDFLASVGEELQSGRYRLLLPMTDVTVQLVSSARNSFLPFVGFPFPGNKQIMLAQDKGHVVRLAQQLGIPCPRTYMLEDVGELNALAGSIRFPVVIKPRFSRFRHDGRWALGPVRFAADATSLVSEYQRAHAKIPYPLIQERLVGEGRGVFLLVWDGELKAAFCHRRLREKPPWGGVSVLCESLPLDNDLVEKSFSLLRALEWQGVAMVEFKTDREDGLTKLMEVNGRFWGSLQLAIDAGMNFPLHLYRLATQGIVPALFDYKIGVKSRWLLGDLDHLLIRLFRGKGPRGAAGPTTSRRRAILDFLSIYEANLRYEVLRFEDPAPGWLEIGRYLEEILLGSNPHGEESLAD